MSRMTSDEYFERHGYDVEEREVDSHGNLTDGDAFRALIAARNEYRAKVAALMHGLSKQGQIIIQDYLDGEEAHDQDMNWWLAGCENHESGSDA